MNPKLQEQYPWIRTWSVRGNAENDLSAAERFLRSKYASEEHVSQDNSLYGLQDEACLVLLGPAGAGKSDAVQQFEARLKSDDCFVYYIDLFSYGSDVVLSNEIKALCSESPDPDKTRITLILDGLDESPAHAPLETICRNLNHHYGDDAGNVHLRLVCRTAYWAARSDLEGVLSNIWSEVSIADIEPLTRQDVQISLQAENIAQENFWASIGNGR